MSTAEGRGPGKPPHVPPIDDLPDQPPLPSANDLLKKGRGTRVAWSIVVAVILHVGAFALWPGWDVPIPDRRKDLEPSVPLALMALPAPPRDLGARGARAIPSSLLPDSLPSPAEEARRGGGPGEDLASTADALRERLLRGNDLLPTVVQREPEPERPVEEPTAEGGEATEIEGEASSTAELATLPDPTELDLDRLSAVRPELALTLPSSWVLIRNPSEVEQFMRRTYRRGELQPDLAGLVSVALWIDERGSVEWAEIDESSGRPDMDRVALELFSEVVAFRPALDEGVPVSRSVIFQVRFPWRYR